MKLEIEINIDKNVGFEVVTEVLMKSTIFWDITPCIPLKGNLPFGGTYRLHLQGRISRVIYQRESRRYVRPKRRLTFNGLHGVLSQNIVLFIDRNIRKMLYHILK
jgi:hypothetical protein